MNEVSLTYSEIEKELKVNHSTVADAMNALIDAQYICKKTQSKYLVNPDLIFWGSAGKRQMVRKDFLYYSTYQKEV